MTATSRRVFMMRTAGSAVALSAGTLLSTPALAAPHVEEADETAVGLGYRHDTTKVDAAKYPKHAKDQHCLNCSFFQGGPKDEWGGCAMFGRKHINANGWCTAWNRKPG